MGKMAVDRDEMVRGDDYTYTATLQVAGVAYNGSGSTWAAKLRETADATAVLATMTVDTTSAASGVLVVSTTDTITAALTTTRAVWDLEETTSAGLKFTWVQVECTVVKDATR